MPRVNAVPELSIVDEEIEISGNTFEPNSAVTVSLSIVHFEILYLGFGHFYSDANGRFSLKEQPSYGGCYRGVQPNGLITGMIPMPSKHSSPRFVVKGSVESPLTFDLQVWKSHLTQDQVHQLHVKFQQFGTTDIVSSFFDKFFLCASTLRRTFMSPGVRRILVSAEVDDEPIRGVLFLPPGNGPFPGHLDVFGAAGGCLEFRAALLAKNGFAAMSLAYFGYEGLTAKTSKEYTMTYFDKAVRWLASHPAVRPGGVSMSGISLGSQIVLLSAIRNANVIGAVCINTGTYMRTDTSIVNPSLLFDQNSSEIWNGMATSIHGYETKIPRPILNHKHDNPILFLLGKEDPFQSYADEAMEQLFRSGKRNVSKVVIDGQGHLMEPPFIPLTVCSSLPTDPGVSHEESYELVSYWGGNHELHAQGQQESWRAMLQFLHQCHSKAISKL